LNLPALGFGMGDVVLLELLKARGLLPPFNAGVDVFFVIEDESLRVESLGLIQALRAAGFAVEFPLVPGKADKQFKRAQELRAGRVVKLERTAAAETTARVRDLKTRDESVIPCGQVVEWLKTGLKRA
jgi:histidyl-tRNA synthetase